MSSEQNLGTTAEGLVLIGSEDMPAGTLVVKGYDFDNGVDFDKLFESFKTTGFQATNLGLAIDEVKKMLSWRLSDEPISPAEDDEWHDPAVRAATKCTIWLSFTSNMVSCGVREVIRYLVQHKLVDVIVTTAGAIEEDVMKTLRPHYMGSFELPGKDLRMRGINRIGNLLVPNLNYVSFEDWFSPLLNAMHDEQEATGEVWSPSKIVHRMGMEMTDTSSVWHWAARNGIPVFCPGMTDGAIGDMIYFHLWKRAGFVVDIAQDIRRINDISVKAKKSGIVILGGSLPKHHVCNANLMRNGADYAVFINTGSDYDGSDSGARPDEAVSWGKIRLTANPVKIYGDASLIFPLLVAQTFAKHVEEE
eukprot:Partr_v1_DN31116_c0_g1_i1_m34937 putative deoxyhypusine synthase